MAVSVYDATKEGRAHTETTTFKSSSVALLQRIQMTVSSSRLVGPDHILSTTGILRRKRRRRKGGKSLHGSNRGKRYY